MHGLLIDSRSNYAAKSSCNSKNIHAFLGRTAINLFGNHKKPEHWILEKTASDDLGNKMKEVKSWFSRITPSINSPGIGQNGSLIQMVKAPPQVAIILPYSWIWTQDMYSRQVTICQNLLHSSTCNILLEKKKKIYILTLL